MARINEEYYARGIGPDGKQIELRTTIYPDSNRKVKRNRPVTAKIFSYAAAAIITASISVGIVAGVTQIDNPEREKTENNSPEPEFEASNEIAIEIELPEDKVEISYLTTYGDNLTKIARKYIKGSDTDVENEIARICANPRNNQKRDDILPAGKTLYILVPVSMAKDFGYGYEYVEVTDKEQMEHFITEAFKARREAGLHPDAKHSFIENEKYATEQIYAAGKITADIEENYEPYPDTYSEEFIEGKKAEIITILKDAVIFTEGATGYTYLQDFVLAPKAIAIPLEPTLTT